MKGSEIEPREVTTNWPVIREEVSSLATFTNGWSHLKDLKIPFSAAGVLEYAPKFHFSVKLN